MDIIYQSMPTTWENKMVEKDLNYADSTVKETRVETLEPKEEKKYL